MLNDQQLVGEQNFQVVELSLVEMVIDDDRKLKEYYDLHCQYLEKKQYLYEFFSFFSIPCMTRACRNVCKSSTTG